jgi:hypothetical protein
MEKNIFNYNSINDLRYRYIKKRMGEKVTLLLSNIKKMFPNSDIYLFGSVIDFTFMKELSDVDCIVKYMNENEKIEIINYITQQNDVKHLTNLFYEYIYLNKKYIKNVLQCEFDNGEYMDISLVDDELLSIQKIDVSLFNNGFFVKCYYMVLKRLYKKHKLIRKSMFYYLKQSLDKHIRKNTNTNILKKYIKIVNIK